MNEVMVSVAMGVKQIVKMNDCEWLWKEKICMGGEECYRCLCQK